MPETTLTPSVARVDQEVLLVAPDTEELAVETWGVMDSDLSMQLALRDPLQAYLDRLVSDESRATVRKRLRAVARVVEVPDYAALPWGQLRANHVAFIKSKLVKAKAAPATVNLTLATLRGVARQARDFNLMSDEEYRRICEIPPHKGTRVPRGRHVRSGELRALVEACARDRTPAGVRDAAMLACLYVGGLRRAELAALQVDHYTDNPPTLTIKSGKGDKDRVVPLEPSAAVAVDAWLVVRGNRPGTLFLPVNKGGRIRGESLTAGAVYNVLAKRAAQAGIEPASPHDLRRSFVVICTQCGHHNAVDRQRARSAGVVMADTLEATCHPGYDTVGLLPVAGVSALAPSTLTPP